MCGAGCPFWEPGGAVLSGRCAFERLDLSGPLIGAAKAKGCKFVISTDAHHPKHLANIGYGIRMARRGWLEPGDVVNTQSAGEFARAIGSK